MTGPCLNLIRIPNHKEKSDSVYFLTFYRKYIKKHNLLRQFFILLWSCFFRYVYSGLIKAKSFFKGNNFFLISLKNLIEVESYEFEILRKSEFCKTPAPKVYPQESQCILVSPHEEYRYPDIYLTKLSTTIVFGSTDMLIKDGDVICHDLFDVKNDLTSEEFHSIVSIDRSDNLITWNIYDDSPFELPTAISLLGACASNYAHWLTETLPKIAFFKQLNELNEIPLIVDDNLHPNILESLTLFVDGNTPIYQLSRGRAVKVRELYVISVVGYVPWGRLDKAVHNDRHGLFSPAALSILRETAGQLFKAEIIYPEKIYIRRNSTARRLINSSQIENALVKEGFFVIEPENLSFQQQVLYFKNAKVIVGVSGAAMANIIFAAEDARIFVLIGNYPYTAFWYWQNLACASGNRVTYVMGEPLNSLGDPIHADITIDLKTLLEAIR